MIFADAFTGIAIFVMLIMLLFVVDIVLVGIWLRRLFH